MSTELPCAVCAAPGTLQCSRCRSMRFCSKEHQAVLWSSHKMLCKPNSLVFRQRPIHPDELHRYVTDGMMPTIAPELSKQGLRTSEEEMVALALRDLTDPRIDPVVQSDHINLALAWNFIHSEHANHDAFSYAGYVLKATILIPATHDRPAHQITSVLGLLDTSTRQKAELQVVVLSTLLEKNSSRELVLLALERLVRIVGNAGGPGREELFQNLKGVVGITAGRRGQEGLSELRKHLEDLLGF